mgnify:CR=1 FL=1
MAATGIIHSGAIPELERRRPGLVIIRGPLVLEPSSPSCVRDLALFCKTFVMAQVILVVEAEGKARDDQYHWLKINGAWDFFYDFIKPGTETGLRIDIEERFPRTIQVELIDVSTLDFLRKRVGGYYGFKWKRDHKEDPAGLFRKRRL